MTALLFNPYCTVRDVQGEIDNQDPDTVDTLIDSINAASRWIDEYLRRDFLYHDCTVNPLRVESAWCAAEQMWLPWPIISLASINMFDSAGNQTVLDSSSYYWENPYLELFGKVYRSGRWMRSDSFSSNRLVPNRLYPLPRNIQITGVFGYALQPAPSAYKQAPGLAPSFDATNYPSPAIPMKIRRACTVIAATWSGQNRKEIIDANSTKQSVIQKEVPKSVFDMLASCRMGNT